MIHNVGETAGKVFQRLNAKGQMSMTRLKKEIGENDMMTTMAVGWLAREGKVELTKNRNVLKIMLTEN